MLVLSRKKNEVIIVNKDIRITVISITGSKVQLGIEAPLSVSIRRQEAELRGEELHATPSVR